MRAKRFHYTLDGVKAMCRSRGGFKTTVDPDVDCLSCLSLAWTFAYRLYNRLEARRPGGGFFKKYAGIPEDPQA